MYLCMRESELHYSSFNCLLLANFPEADLLTGHELVLLRNMSRVLRLSAPCKAALCVYTDIKHNAKGN